jgi:DNA-directed RNA polymerase specialized sigma24 family protein
MAESEVENDDEILLTAVRNGSDRAFNTLIDHHQQAVRTFLRGLMANDSDAILVRQAMQSLPMDQRATIMLCLGSEYTHAEASEMLGIPLGTIKSYVLRGRQKLRELLGDQR